MASQVLANRSDLSSYTMNVLLETLYYVLDFDWNGRASRWYMTLSDSTGSLIVGALPVLIKRPLLRGTTTDRRRPPGDFIALDTKGQDIEAGLNDLGARVLLYYVPSTDYQKL